MINTSMRLYDYFTIGAVDSYGQDTFNTSDPEGKVKISINISSQATQDNILYKDCTYVGITRDAQIDDTYIINYNGEMLKVLYVNPLGRNKQVFLAEM